jgi:hypothetical protein
MTEEIKEQTEQQPTSDSDPNVVAEAIKKFREDFKNRSFAERHVELGKMINCQICGLRHRSSQKCEQRISTPAASNTRKGVYGAAIFAKKRIHVHHSKKSLQLVQLTQELFSKYYENQIKDPQKAMIAARGEARATLLRNRRDKKRKKRNQQKESRKINRR